MRFAVGALAAICAVGGATASAQLDPSAPDPGGREGAIVKVPPPGKYYFGVHEETIRSGPPDPTAQAAAKAGAEIMRYTIDWQEVEPVRDQWDHGQWNRYRAIYKSLLERGIKPLITIAGAPPWSRDIDLIPLVCNNGRGCEYPPRPAMFGEWAEFAGEVARRFPRAAAIEIWNEPNLWSFWKPEPEPERYAAMVAAAYDAIKAQNRRIQVLGGALAAANFTKRDGFGLNTTMSMREFLRRAYKASPSLAGHVDGISFHQVSQATFFGRGSQLARAFRDARVVRNNYGDRKTPFWITEFSLSTSDGPRVTRQVQAKKLLRAYRKVMTIRDARAFLVHTLVDRNELPSDDREHGIGLVESVRPLVPKPSFCAFSGRLRNGHPDCRKIRESRVSRCTRVLAILQKRIGEASGSKAKALRSRHRRKTADCVPCARKIDKFRRAVNRAGADERAIRNAISRLKGKCKPCQTRLTRLQRRHSSVMPTLRLDVLNRHEKARRRCR